MSRHRSIRSDFALYFSHLPFVRHPALPAHWPRPSVRGTHLQRLGYMVIQLSLIATVYLAVRAFDLSLPDTIQQSVLAVIPLAVLFFVLLFAIGNAIWVALMRSFSSATESTLLYIIRHFR